MTRHTDYINLGIKRQKFFSDISKKAKNKSRYKWGGRRLDGPQDKIRKKFAYINKKIGNNQKKIYKYSTNYKKKYWKSYKKKYIKSLLSST